MFSGYLLPYQAMVYVEENNQMKLSLGTHKWEDEYDS